ncbi:methyltransferase [Actinotalea fermentans]|uniref:Methyltransferase type 12 domain-containing protein n=1 Tax=Actinotalea fermentans TaxID=43671 RepID=A0A511Z2F7_9CELL|nr:methyltransferase [Actinotalea fermentans]KGM16663.1 hypothetical protein N867_17610 [Actinotalea fermentans ATCC 43279 = JCM 9966 = DSM 3133]GEN81632.1 hypothetical protein AFE02nite_33660 [Actinotalea fermentans]
MSTDPTAETPLRALPTRRVDGVHIVRETGQSWLDGSEEILFERMTTSGLPLDSLSDELFATATNWPEQYHLSPSRANVLRALDLPSDAVVLEIGAGCGAITRYLGERCASVDALEPTLARARVAAARTAELPHVRVFNAEVADLPQVPAYDLVVVVGVLEYVGSGKDDTTPYVEFLSALRGVLRPGGRLVLAIENRMGVKYLAGAPEDHSGEVFHSVEGYREDGPARTFSRRRLLELARLAGYRDARALGAFPDYKLTRLVFDDALLCHSRELAVQIPRFPSPDWATPRPALVDEGRLWAQLVDAGAAGELANSLVLVAQAGGGTDDVEPEGLWPAERLAVYFSMRRRRPFQVLKRVDLVDEVVTVTSVLLGHGEADGLRVLPYSEPAVDGTSLVDKLLREPERLPELVGVWARLLEGRAKESSEGTPVDVLPHNVHFVDGVGRFIDDEWRSDAISLNEAKLRGAVLLARDLSQVRPLRVWRAASVTALAVEIARHAGVKTDADGIRKALDREAEFQARVGGGKPGSEAYATTREVVRVELGRQFSTPQPDVAPERVWEAGQRAQQEAIEARDLLFETGRQLEAARAELDRQPTVRLARAFHAAVSQARRVARGGLRRMSRG